MPCRSQKEEEDLERVEADRCLMGSLQFGMQGG
jgi:hypothetical protein